MDVLSLNDLTWLQVLTLHNLVQHGSGTVIDVAALVECPRETVRHALLRLTQAHLVSRVRTPHAKRPKPGNLPHTYTATPQGQKLMQRAHQLLQA